MAIKDLGYPFEVVQKLIDTARDGLESQQLVRQRWEEDRCEYALILSDCQMPRCDGYKATLRIREYIRDMNLQQPVIVACTGNVEQVQIKRAFDCTFDELVPKPVNIDIVKRILAEIIVF